MNSGHAQLPGISTILMLWECIIGGFVKHLNGHSQLLAFPPCRDSFKPHLPQIKSIGALISISQG